MEDENRKYNQEKLISHEVRCYNCQKLSKKHIFTTRLMGPNENLPYGLEVIKYEDIRLGSVTKRKYTVWDKKYVMNKGFFCSSKCAGISLFFQFVYTPFGATTIAVSILLFE